MAFNKGTTPWNKGKTGIEAGWTPERRQRQSELQREFVRNNPNVGFNGRSGPLYWKHGPDPDVRRHRYRFLRARAQAKFWGQEWTIIWEDYLDLLKTAPGKWDRQNTSLNLARIDTTKGWHIWNVRLMNRIEAMSRRHKGNRRIRPRGLGSKKRGITWSRGGNSEG